MEISFRFVIWYSLLCSFKIESSNIQNMIVVWGKPGNFSSSTTLQLSWEDCIASCLDTDPCVLIYKLTEQTCQMFALDEIVTVEKLNSSMSSKVAFKLPMEDTCAPDESSALQSPISGYTFRDTWPNQSYTVYNITFDEDLGTWTFRKFAYHECPEGSRMFFRTKGMWCLVPFLTASENRSTALKTCGSNGAFPDCTLSGIDSEEEFDWVTSRVQTLGNDAFWLDGLRKSSCMYPAVKSESCNGTSEFDFLDPLLTLPGYLYWQPDRPNGITTDPTMENCVYFKVENGVGMVDDCQCDITMISYPSQLNMSGQVCGVQPKAVLF